jgi:hypothetical protein
LCIEGARHATLIAFLMTAMLGTRSDTTSPPNLLCQFDVTDHGTPITRVVRPSLRVALRVDAEVSSTFVATRGIEMSACSGSGIVVGVDESSASAAAGP